MNHENRYFTVSNDITMVAKI